MKSAFAGSTITLHYHYHVKETAFDVALSRPKIQQEIPKVR